MLSRLINSAFIFCGSLHAPPPPRRKELFYPGIKLKDGAIILYYDNTWSYMKLLYEWGCALTTASVPRLPAPFSPSTAHTHIEQSAGTTITSLITQEANTSLSHVLKGL